MSPRWLLGCGVVAGPLFTLGYVVAGITRDGYSSRRHLVSSLALGPHGWFQSASFVASGLLLLAFTWGLARATSRDATMQWGPRLMAAAAVVLVVAGLFTTDPISGYPAGTPDRPITYTLHGTVHAACALLGFLILVAAMVVFVRAFARRRERGWMLYSLASSLVTTAAFFLMLQGISQKAGWVEFGGLFERIAFGVGLGWVTAIAWRFLRGLDDAPARVAPRRAFD